MEYQRRKRNLYITSALLLLSTVFTISLFFSNIFVIMAENFTALYEIIISCMIFLICISLIIFKVFYAPLKNLYLYSSSMNDAIEALNLDIAECMWKDVKQDQIKATQISCLATIYIHVALSTYCNILSFSWLLNYTIIAIALYLAWRKYLNCFQYITPVINKRLEQKLTETIQEAQDLFKTEVIVPMPPKE